MTHDDARRILIVDDDFDVRDALSQILREEGYDVFAVANGREALEHLRGAPLPALILLDLMMPVMNGWQFRAAQMNDPSVAHIPVLVLTAGNLRDGVTAVDAAGYIQKPIDLDGLLVEIARFLTRDRGDRAGPRM